MADASASQPPASASYPSDDRGPLIYHFMGRAPPAQSRAVASDVSKTLGTPLGKLLPALAKQHAKSFTLADIEGDEGGKVIICPAAAVDTKHFIHSPTGRVMAVDHGKLRARPAGEGAPAAPAVPEEIEPLRKELDAAANEYATKVFAGYGGPQGAAGAFSRGGEIMVVLSGERRDTDNYLASRWASRWAFGPESGKLRGRIEVVSHYFENGSVQACFDRRWEDVPLRGRGSEAGAGPVERAGTVLRAIAGQEADFQEAILMHFGHLSDQGVQKTLRRLLPVSKQPMVWEAGQHRTRRLLGYTAPAAAGGVGGAVRMEAAARASGSGAAAGGTPGSGKKKKLPVGVAQGSPQAALAAAMAGGGSGLKKLKKSKGKGKGKGKAGSSSPAQPSAASELQAAFKKKLKKTGGEGK